MIQLQKFLVPLDGSETSAQIIPWVSALARSMGSSLALLTVVPPARDIQGAGAYRITGEAPGAPGGPTIAVGLPPTAAYGLGGEPLASQPVETARAVTTATQQVDAVRQMAFDYLTSQKAALADKGITAETHVESGDAATEIVKVADTLGASAIAMSTRRAGALARGILGSVTDRVLHMADRPMLVIHPREGGGGGPADSWPQTVIVPLDGSPLSETAVPIATAVARAAGAKIIYLRAMAQVTSQTVAGFTTAAEAEYGLELEKERLGGQGDQYLHRFVEDARGQGLGAEAQVYAGRPDRRIVELAAEQPGALVVMTTRGRSGVQRWVLGSVTDKVVRSSGQPVLVLPPIMPETIAMQEAPTPPRPSSS